VGPRPCPFERFTKSRATLAVDLEPPLPESLRIDLPTASLALSLLECLEDFRAEVVPLGGERYQVLVELDGGPEADDRTRESLALIESWLKSTGLNVAEIHLDGRPSGLERRNGSPLRSLDTPEPVGLVCRVKTIALGASVQVVSAEGEVDLHTAPQLGELLRSVESGHVILDLTEATFIDSMTLNILIASDKHLRGEGREFAIAAGNPTVARIFEITGLDRALDVHRTLAEAIESVLEQAVDAVEARQDGSAG
jgi:anti-anti-sigma factor